MHFTHAWWLLAAPVFLYLLWRMQRESFAEGSKTRMRFWLVIRSIVLLLILAALAGLQTRNAIRQNQTLFLLDVSDSISEDQKQRAITWINQTIQRIHPPDQTGVIVFGSNAAVERFPRLPFPLTGIESPVKGTATNLERGAKLAEALFAENYQKNLIVISDGEENAGSAEDQFRALRDKGVLTQSMFLEPTGHPEASLEAVRFPEEVHLKEPFSLEVLTSGNRKMPALLQVFRNGSLLQEAAIELPAGSKNLTRLPQQIPEPGTYRYEVRLQPANDYRLENNSMAGWISVEGASRILIVDANPREEEGLKQALENRGFQVEVKPAQFFPLTLEEMVLYQAIVVRNIPAAHIHDQMPLIRQYVHDFGGGFAMLGGEQSFGPGGYHLTPVESVLPVRMDLVNKKYLADVAMVIVIDKSGSMSYADRGKQKIDLADEGGARVASMLKQSDQLGVLAVDSVPKWAFSLQKLNNGKEAIDAITSIRAGGGGIYVYSGLQRAYEELRNTKASVKHVILFADTADCEEKDGASGESSLALAQAALRDHRITTTTIGIGKTGDVDVEFLRQIAIIGEGRFYFTDDMFTLPEIFTQESSIVQRYYITEERFTPELVTQEPLLSGLQTIPDLDGYVATSLKPGATLALQSHRKDPVLACWRYGLGYSIAYTSEPAGDWASRWPAWPGYQRFWAQIARYVAQERKPARFRTLFSSNGENTGITVEAQDEQGAFLDRATFSGILIDDAGHPYEVHFSQSAPGTYTANVPATGLLFGKLFRMEGNAIQEEATVQFSGTAGREFEYENRGRELLRWLTGRLVNSPEEISFPEGTSEEVAPLQSRLLLWAAFLFLLDVAARKINPAAFRFAPQKQTPEAIASSPLLKLKDRKKAIHKKAEPAVQFVLEERDQQNVIVEKEPHVTETIDSEYMQRLKEAKKRSRDK